MTSAFVDTSTILAVTSEESDFREIADRLERFDTVYAPDPRELTFLTLDKRQRKVAAALGFAT